MKRDSAKKFWRGYMDVLCRGGGSITMVNPLEEFRTRANKGGFAALTDEEYFQNEQQAAEFASFWKYKPKEVISNIIANALAKIDLSEEDQKMIADIIAEASVNTKYDVSTDMDEIPWAEDVCDFEPADMPTPFDDLGWTPRSIYNYLENRVYGQKEAKRAAAMLVYQHLHGNRRNVVMAGPTGCGKTEIWRTLSREFDCIKILNGPQISCDGWKGSYHIKDIFLDEPREKAGKQIIVIDEADKLFEPTVGAGGTDFAQRIQNELLKIMDGDTITFVEENNTGRRLTVDCSGISMVFCGSFERMLKEKTAASGSIGFGQPVKTESVIAECSEEDLIQYANVRREIAGRINQIVTLDMLDSSDFEAILKSKASPIEKLEKTYGITLSVDDEIRKKLATEAAESGLGCRYIFSRLQSMLDDKMFDTPESKAFVLAPD
ncbi:AAA family ATPase [Roseburia hominis]